MIRQTRLALERLIRRIRVRRCAVPFVVLFRERTGSTHLCSLIDSHPDVLCRGENFALDIASEEQVQVENENVFEFNRASYVRQLSLFRKQVKWMPQHEDVVKHFHDIYSYPAVACGFKFKHDIQFALFPEVMHELSLIRKQLRVIVLRRNNALRQAISVANMVRVRTIADGASNFYDPQGKLENAKLDGKLVVDVESLVKRTKRFQMLSEQFETDIQQLLPEDDSRLLNVTYRQVLNDEPGTASRIFEFLSVDPDVKVESKIHKATPRRLVDAIENYRELELALRGTELELFLEDE